MRHEVPTTPPADGTNGRYFTERLLDFISTGVVTADRDQRIAFANRMAVETLQTSLPRLAGRSVVEAFGGHEKLADALAEVPEGGERRLDFAWTPAGTTPVEMGMSVMRAAAGEPPELSFVLLFRDLGTIRHFELEMRRVERLAALGKMMAGLAHEIRNPLTGVRCLADALHSEIAAGDPRREYATRIQSLVDRIERLVRSSLQFAEPHPADKRAISPEALVRSALEEMAPQWREGWPELAIEPDLPWVEADSGQIGDCLIALIDNALDAAGHPARVYVRLRADDTPGLLEGATRTVRIDVADDGPGIEPGELARVFDPFFTTKPKGTGLGLSIAQALVAANGGRILVQSPPGGGAMFSIVLAVPKR